MDPARLGAVFSASRRDYMDCARLVWAPMGEALVDRVAPEPGHQVLDACCGAGASALPAAAVVGTEGSVDAIDVAGGLLAAGREAASACGLTNVHFVEADVTVYPERGCYDVVQCGYGVFFLPNMDDASRRLVGLVRPGGRFGITVWKRGALEDYGKALYDVLARYRPGHGQEGGEPHPITRINTPESLRAWLIGLELSEPEVKVVPRSIPLTPEFAWAFILGSGFRGVLDGLGPAQIHRLRADFLALLGERGIDAVDISTLVGVGVARGGNETG